MNINSSKSQAQKAYLEAKFPQKTREEIIALSRYVVSSRDSRSIYLFASKFHNLINYHTYVDKIIELADIKYAYFTARDIPGLSSQEIQKLETVILESDPYSKKILKISCTWDEIAKYSTFFLRDIPTKNPKLLLSKIDTALSSNSMTPRYIIQTLICLSRLPSNHHHHQHPTLPNYREFVLRHTIAQIDVDIRFAVARSVPSVVFPLAQAIMELENGEALLERLLKELGPKKLRGRLRSDILDRISTYEVVNS